MIRAALLLVLCVVAACSKGKSDEELLAELTEQKPLDLPPSDGTSLQRAPVIVVTTTEISYQGRLMASVDDVVKDPRALEPLAHALQTASVMTTYDLVTGAVAPELVQACHDAARNIRPMSGTICPAGLAILQADQATDMRVVNAVVNTARASGYDNLLFAVKSK